MQSGNFWIGTRKMHPLRSCIKMNAYLNEKGLVPVPKAYVTSPIFSAKSTTESRTVYLANGTRYTIGGNLLDTGKYAPALDVRHLRLLLVLLFFRQRDYPPPSKITFSMNEACHHYASSQGGRYSREIMRLFEDLKNSCFEVQEAGARDFFIYPILKDFRVRGRYRRRKPKSDQMQKELHLEYAELHENFIPILMETVHFDLSAFKKMSSPIAQAVYAFIPSRATYRPKDNPFSITITTILKQIGAAIPQAKWARKKLFTQNKVSILKQLNGAPTRTGFLRVIIEETSDKEDYKLLFWEERAPADLPIENQSTLNQKKAPHVTSVFFQIWIDRGGTNEGYQRKTCNLPEITPYEQGLMQMAKIEFKGNERAFQVAKVLIGDASFEECLGYSKSYAIENKRVKKSHTSLFIHKLKEYAKSVTVS